MAQLLRLLDRDPKRLKELTGRTSAHAASKFRST